MAISTYIVNRDPNRYGGQQDDYKAQVKKIVSEGTEKLQTAKTNRSDLKKFFLALQSFLEVERHRLAEEHKSNFADQFALKRNSEQAVARHCTHAYTHLENTYKDYGDKMLNGLIQRLGTMKHDPAGFQQRKLETIEPECFGRRSTFEIEIYSKDEIKKLHWDQPPDYSGSAKADKIANYPNLTLFEKLKGLSKKEPALYQQDRMHEYIKMLNLFHPDLQKTDFVLATKRQQINGKLVPVSQYLTWINCNGKEDPLVVMKNESRILVLHQDIMLLDDSMNDIAALFEKAVKWKPANGIKDLKDRVGLFRGAYAEAMPHHHGSGAIGEYLENIIYRSHTNDIAYAEDKSLDLESLTSFSLAEFMKAYHNDVTVTKRV